MTILPTTHQQMLQDSNNCHPESRAVDPHPFLADLDPAVLTIRIQIQLLCNAGADLNTTLNTINFALAACQ